MSTLIPVPRRLAPLALTALALASLAGCSDSSNPPAPAGDQGSELVAGELQPGTGSVVLRRLEQSVPGFEPIRVALIGSNLQVDAAAQTVSLDVAVRNEGGEALHAPATIWLADFAPPAVTVANADFYEGAPDSDAVVAPRPRWGFDYSALLGGDALLEPEETSEAKTWIFHVPGLTGFSFRARPEFGLVPDLPRIAGRVFLDRNRDGVPQPEEPPAPVGVIHAVGPDGYEMTAVPGPEGGYALPVTASGLYTLTLRLFPSITPTDPAGGDDGFAPVEFTTPNPLEVLLVPGPDGPPLSFLDAHFGVISGPGGQYPPVLPAPVPLDSLGGDHYAYLAGRLEGPILRLRVGYSGCQPEHPLQLFWEPGPQASPLPHVNLALVHDGLGEMCDAYWERGAGFDLTPLRAAMGVRGLIVLHFKDFQGEWHHFEWYPAGRDSF